MQFAPPKRHLRLLKNISEIFSAMVASMHSAVLELQKMPIKPPFATEMDLVRGRQIVSSLTPLKRLSSDDAELVARTIAQIRAEGRKQGLDLARVDVDSISARADYAEVIV